MSNKEKSIYLLSNGSTKYFPENTLTSFKNKLPFNLETNQDEKFEVAVQSIGFITNFRNLELPKNKELPSFITFQTKKGVNLITNDQIEKNFENEEFKNNITNQHNFYFQDEFYNNNDLEVYFERVNEKTTYSNFSLDSENKTLKIEPKNLQKNLKSSYYVMIHPTLINSFGLSTKELIAKLPKRVEFYSRDEFDPFLKEKLKMRKLNVDNKNFYQFNSQTRGYFNEILKLDSREFFINFKNENYLTFLIDANEKYFVYGTKNIEEINFPFYVKVQSSNIVPNILDSNYSSDLICFSPEFKANEQFYFHEFKNKEFSTLNNTILDNFEINLLDENNEKLNLLSGISTFIHLRIRKMYNEDLTFNIRCSSKIDHENLTNTSYKFKKNLPQTLTLNKNWRMALTSISYPTTFSTFLKDPSTRTITIKKIQTDDAIILHEFKIPDFINFSRNDLLNIIDLFLRKTLCGSIQIKNDKFSIMWDIGSNYKKYEIEIPIGLLKLLGYDGVYSWALDFDENNQINNQDNRSIKFSIDKTKDSSDPNLRIKKIENKNNIYELIFNKKMDLTYFHPNYIIIYLNVLNTTLVGGEFMKVLKIFPVKYNKTTNYTIMEFENKEFIELQNTEIKELEFELRGHDGEFISFQDDKNVIINLELKNY